MNEIYWITRLSSIHGFCVAILIFSLIIFACGVITYLIFFESYEEEERKCGRKMFRYSIIPLIISMLGVIFIPTTKEALMIYGIGGTIDYLKENPTAKQRPDKYVNALDKWADSWVNEENPKNKNN